ncbi:hypothetical protein EYF80_016299 [Liparis tanakae]|uniref:Uncharacterized protein n=1 Tax=Liparis tanakae TaxID=230148 RepID=A0A4Z2I635_9TELE|nr:hypothetical protein EYF80_016299 [Liparis tanakae]
MLNREVFVTEATFIYKKNDDRPPPRYPSVFSKCLRRTCERHGAGGQDRQQALSLQVEEMLLLHLKKLLLDGNLLRGQLGDGDDTTAVSKCPHGQVVYIEQPSRHIGILESTV